MAGLLLLAAVAGWSFVCVAISRYLTKGLLGWKKQFSIIALPPVLFLLPFTNQLVGWFQYEYYCAAADDVKIFGTIQSPKELYSPSGEWLLGRQVNLSTIDEYSNLVKLADSFLTWDHGSYVELYSLTNVGKRNTKIYEKSSNRLLAEWSSYSYKGGLSGLMGSTDVCHPKLFADRGYQLYNRLFVYQKQ